jgi:hypothetical protein
LSGKLRVYRCSFLWFWSPLLEWFNEFCIEDEDLDFDENALGLLIFMGKRASCKYLKMGKQDFKFVVDVYGPVPR